MHRHLRPLLLLAALAIPSLSHAAEALALLPASGVNVDVGTLAAAHEVLRGHLMAQRLDVRPAGGGPVADLEPSAADAAAAARQVGARRAAVLRLVTLGATLRARLTVYDAASGAPVHNDELAADAIADLDPALERLARAYASGGAARSSADMDTLTVKESQPVPKIQASTSFGFRIGALYPQAASAGDQGATGGGFYWLYDTRAFLLDLAFDAYWGKGSHTGYAGFGAYYPLTKTNVAPYAGGGVRYAWADYGAQSGHGFQLYGTAGVLIGRLSTAGLRGELEWWVNAFDTGPSANANGLAWKLGVYF